MNFAKFQLPEFSLDLIILYPYAAKTPAVHGEEAKAMIL
jgi:hypothetical protein